MEIICFYARGWESNSYLLTSRGEAVLIDAGVPTKQVLDALSRENATLKYVLLTHGHFDHTVTADAVREATGAKLAIHKNDEEMLSDAEKSALAAFFGRHDTVGPCDLTLKEGDKISFGEEELTVIHTPGHSMGSVCYLVGDRLFSGDTLFNGGFGRYDLYGGDADTLRTSLIRLKSLDPEICIFPGHGDSAPLKRAIEILNFI